LAFAIVQFLSAKDLCWLSAVILPCVPFAVSASNSPFSSYPLSFDCWCPSAFACNRWRSPRYPYRFFNENLPSISSRPPSTQ